MPTQPNIIFIFSDQQRWDTVGAYGQPLPVTPNLDRMAREGVLYENAFTCQPVCGPARACLQTGRYATEIGCYRNGIALPLTEKTLAHHLAGTGYEVGYLGKWHLASTEHCPEMEPDIDYREKPVPPERRGGYRDYWLASDVLEFTSHGYDGHMFDGAGQRREFPAGRYRADAQTDWALEYLQTRRRDRPFFLFCSYIEPHHQNDHKCYEGPHGSKAQWANYPVPGDLEGTGGDWRENYPDYLGCIHSLDANLGRIRAELQKLGLAENTLVIYTSDHGSHFCTRNKEYKRACHDGCTHIPLIIHGPGFTGGKRQTELVSLLDLPPTVLAAGGVTPPAPMRGRPLQQLAAGTPADWPQDVFIQISESQVGRALRTERWTYSVSAPDAPGWRQAAAAEYIEEYLYDNSADPHQRANLVQDPATADIRAELRARLIARLRESGETQTTIRTA